MNGQMTKKANTMSNNYVEQESSTSLLAKEIWINKMLFYVHHTRKKIMWEKVEIKYYSLLKNQETFFDVKDMYYIKWYNLWEFI